VRLLKLLLVLLVCAAGPAVAGPYDDAVAAHRKGDYATAIRLLRPLAEQGHAKAQWALGSMNSDGVGMPKNYVAALTWYQKAADQGYARAQIEIGFMYGNGYGVPKDMVQAYKWYLIAARYAAKNVYVDDDIHIRELANTALEVARELDVTPAQIAEAQKLAREWKPKPER
jgi:hypothetical protein